MMRRPTISALWRCTRRLAIKHRAAWLALLALGDVLAVVVAYSVCFWVRYGTPLFSPATVSLYRFVLLQGLSAATVAGMLTLSGGYRLPQRFRLHTASATLLRAMLGHVIVITLALFLLRLGTWSSTRPFLYSRLVVGAGWVMMFVLLLGWRLALGRLQRACFDRGWSVRRAVVVGVGPHAQRLAAALDRQRWIGDRVLGWVGAYAGETPEIPDLGDAADLPAILARQNVDVIWLAWTGEQHSTLLELVCAASGLSVKWAMARDDFDRFLQAVSSNVLPASLTSWMVDDLVAELDRRVEHHVEPLAGPHVTFVGSRGIPATYGGVERYVEEVSTRLARRGYRVSVYCRPHYTNRRGNYCGVELRRLPCIPTKHLEAISHTFLATWHVLFCEDEIVHYQAQGPALLIWLPRLFGRKTVVTVQGLDWQRSKWGRLARAVLKAGEWASAHLPDRTIVVSQDLEQHYREQYGITAMCIPNGVNDTTRKAAREIQRWGLEPGRYILSVGRLVPEKGYDMLLRAFGRVKTDKMLVVVGGSSYTDAYVAGLRNSVTQNSVVFTGYVYGTVLDELFSNAYLFVSASEVEGLPIALLEAMSFGVCVLASDIPPHQEMLGGLGYTFRAQDEQGLAASLQTLLEQPNLVKEAGEKLRRRVLDTYNWERIVDATEILYRQLLEV